MPQQPTVGQGLLIIEVSRSHSGTPQSVALLWKRVRHDAQTATWQHTTLTEDTAMPPVGFEPVITVPSGCRPAPTLGSFAGWDLSVSQRSCWRFKSFATLSRVHWWRFKMFRRIEVPSSVGSSGLRRLIESGLLYPEYEGAAKRRNAGYYLPINTASHSTELKSSIGW